MQLLHDSGSRGFWLNKLATLVSADVESALKLQCVDSLIAALNGCKDLVQISDSDDRLVYANPACERILGFDPAADLSGRDAWDLQSTVGAAGEVVGDTLREEEEEEVDDDDDEEKVRENLDRCDFPLPSLLTTPDGTFELISIASLREKKVTLTCYSNVQLHV